jgi:hypothetical protein
LTIMADDLGFTYARPTVQPTVLPAVDPLRPTPRRGLAARLAEIERLRERDRDEDRAVIFSLAIGITFCLLMLALLFLSQPRGNAIDLPAFPEQAAAEVEDIWTLAPVIEIADLSPLPASTLGEAADAVVPDDASLSVASVLIRALLEDINAAAAAFQTEFQPRTRPEPVPDAVPRPAAPSTKPVPPEAMVAARRPAPTRASAPGAAPGAEAQIGRAHV